MRFFLAALLALVCATGASAHPTGRHSGFVSTVSVIDPLLPGLIVQVVGGHERLSVSNLTRKTVVILDHQHRPLARIPPGQTRVWADPRIGSTEAPPEKEGLVRNWRIPGTADGEPFEIVGFLGYRPPPGAASGNDGLPTWAVGLALAAGALVLAAALVLLRRLREQE